MTYGPNFPRLPLSPWNVAWVSVHLSPLLGNMCWPWLKPGPHGSRFRTHYPKSTKFTLQAFPYSLGLFMEPLNHWKFTQILNVEPVSHLFGPSLTGPFTSSSLSRLGRLSRRMGAPTQSEPTRTITYTHPVISLVWSTRRPDCACKKR